MLRISLLERLDKNCSDDRILLPKNFHRTFEYYQSKCRWNGQSINDRDSSRALLTHLIVQRLLQIEENRQRDLMKKIESKRKEMRKINVDFHCEISSRKSFRQRSAKSKRDLEENFSRRFSMYQSKKIQSNFNRRAKRKKEIRRRVESNECVISMIYLGRKIFADEGQSNGDEILLLQQHSGGENLSVFKGFLRPNDRFEFVSRRHPDYPFALTFYINGLIDSRISTCCEMKHQCGFPLGGRKGSFIIEDIQRAQFCRQCRFQQFIKSKFDEKDKEEEKESIIDENDLANEIYEKLRNELNENVHWEKKCFVNWQMGNLFFQGFHQIDRSLEYYFDALEILFSHQLSFNDQLRDFYLIISFLLEEKNEIHLARKYFERLLQIDLKKRNVREEILFKDYFHLSILYEKEMNYSSALIYAEESLQYQSFDVENQQFFPNYSPENLFDRKLFDYLSAKTSPTKEQIENHLDDLHSFISENLD